jgi:oxygen-dependent protoporphyrinogen oxidase
MNTRLYKASGSANGQNRAAHHVVIVGGGIAGLSAAWYLQQETLKQSLSYTVLEQSDRWGGKIQTDVVEGFGESPFVLERGPDGFLRRKPSALRLVRELGLEARIVGTKPENSRTFVLHHGKPLSLPEGLQLLAPTKVFPFLRSPLFSLWGKLRVGMDWFIPPRRMPDDETLADFVRRRFGNEMLETLAEPLLAGVYNGEAERQSILATFPQFPALEKQYGSVIRGVRASRRDSVAESAAPFFSFRQGAHELVKALVAQLTGELRLNTAVRSIRRSTDSTYIIVTDDGAAIRADAVILATPAKTAAALVYSLSPGAANLLNTIRTASIGSIYLGFRRADVAHPLNGFGMVIPGTERRRIDGITWTSSKWDHRTPSGYVLLRVFFGGPHTRDMMALDDSHLLAAVQEEIQSLLGIRPAPLFYRIYRWPDGYPQYDWGHLERVAAIESQLPPGLTLTGSAYRGVGVPDCIQQGQAEAQKIAAFLSPTAISEGT